MKTRSVSRPTTSASSTPPCGSAAARRLSTSACKLLIHPSFRQQKSGRAPAFGPASANRRPNESCEGEDSTVDPGKAVEKALLEGRVTWRRVAVGGALREPAQWSQR